MKGTGSADHVKERVAPRGAIRDWPAGERPREKLLRSGAQTMERRRTPCDPDPDGEQGRNALDLACGVLDGGRGLAGLARRNALS